VLWHSRAILRADYSPAPMIRHDLQIVDSLSWVASSWMGERQVASFYPVQAEPQEFCTLTLSQVRCPVEDFLSSRAAKFTS